MPPVADTVTVVVPPLHKILLALDDALRVLGSVKVMLLLVEHPFASLTVTS